MIPLGGHLVPYTDFHRLNLDWLLTTVKEHDVLYQELIKLPDLAAEMADLWKYIDQQFNTTISYVDTEIIRCLKESKDYTDAEITILQNYILTVYNNGFDSISDNIADLGNQILFNNDYIKKWCELQFELIKTELLEIPLPAVYNPITATYQSVDKVFKSFYDYLRYEALSCGDFDSLSITCKQFEDLNISCLDFDLYGKRLVYDHFFNGRMMRSPFTGTMETEERVINRLAELHMKGLTAQEYDSMDLTCGAFESENKTAYMWDWEGIADVQGWTASQYDSSTYTAQGYDDLDYTAYQFDWVGIL